ncbi:MAG: carboxypeptidase regulatory-like domain-containing protein [Clostridia bacterium]|nr:carboxypeptidase regulatory-like domain-containing protein [Clostridia bacterium]
MRVLPKRGWIVFIACLLLLFLGAAEAMAEGQVSGTVWVEKNVDGNYESGESGYGFGAKITLEKRYPASQNDQYINKMSDQTGAFVFTGLAAGEYRMRIEVTNDYHFTAHGTGSCILPSQGNVGYTPYFTVQDGVNLIMNVGLTKNYCAVSLIAFVDENANGGRLQQEPLVQGVQAEVLYEYAGETYVVASSATNMQGEAVIRDLSPGTYKVRVTLPNNLVIGPMGQKISTFYNCFYANADNTGISDAFTLAAKETIGMGVGLVRTGSLTGKVWYDANFNGMWDAGEGGLTQAVVTLYSPGLGLTRTAYPNELGDYAFQSLQSGEYRLSFQLPEGMIFTYPGVSMISETASQAAVNVSVQVGVTTNLGSVGAMPSAGLSLYLYQDADLNGNPDETDLPVYGAQVTAFQGGNAIETAFTDQQGRAVFHMLRGGETQLSVALPQGYVFSADQTQLFRLSTAGAQTVAETTVYLDGSQAEVSYSAAVTTPGAVTGCVFEDAENTGIYREGSLLVPGVAVQAVDQNGSVRAQTQTDASGVYSFSSMLPGTYCLRFLLTEDYVASSSPAQPQGMYSHIMSQTPEYGQTESFTLSPGQTVSGMDGGVFRAGRVDGYVLIDEEFASAGTGLAGVSVTLLNENGQPASAYSYGTTDDFGYFFIKGVLPGTYSIQYAMPDNGQFISPRTAEKQWTSPTFVSESGSETHMDTLYGVYTSTLSGRIIYDGIGTDENFTALISLVGQRTRQAFQIHAQPDGSYEFNGLKPDTYVMQVMLPDYLVFGETEGSPIAPTADSTATSAITFSMGEQRTDANILASLPVTISGVVFYDDDMSASMEENEYGAEGRSLSLWRNGEETAFVYTDEDGRFAIEHLIPADYELRIGMDENEVLVNVDGAMHQAESWTVPLSVRSDSSVTLPMMRYSSISGQVWSLDGSMSGVNGLYVALLDEDGGTVASAMTDETGAYEFTRLLPGNYTLNATLPMGHLFARAQDTENRESYIQGNPDGSPKPIPFTLPMGEELSGVDIGMGAMGEIGDRAWLDENGNGMQDVGEPYMPGIIIALYQHGEKIAETVTNEYGKYMISDVYPGEYEMHVTMHKELKATVQQTEFPLVASIMPAEKGTTIVVPSVIVPSGGQNLHCDLGFQLRKKGVYPDAINDIPVKDWRPYSER